MALIRNCTGTLLLLLLGCGGQYGHAHETQANSSTLLLLLSEIEENSALTVGRRVFACQRDVQHGLTIFASRLRDGVCDCCDGSDESPGVCENRCESDLVQAKRSALLWHRTVQSGRHKRQELLNELDRRRRKESDKFSHLEQQLRELDLMRLKMKYHLQREVIKENRERFRLLRERLANCILGIYEMCDFFRAGFFNDDELRGYDSPHDDPSGTKKPRLRLVHSTTDIGYMKELSGPARVRGSLCLVPDILRDDTHKISASTGEYLAFMETPQGQASLRVQDYEKVLFIRFMDEGEYGYMMGAIALGELASFALLPVTGIFYGLEFTLQHTSQFFWSCLVESTAAVHPSFAMFTDTQSLSRASAALQYLDLTSYSAFARLWDRVHPFVTWPTRVSRLLWYAPKLYYQYYLTNASVLLPPRRICCLLRSGLEAGAAEGTKLAARLQEENAIRDALRQQDLTTAQGDVTEAVQAEGGSGSLSTNKARHRAASTSTARKQKHKRSTAQLLIDYGPLKEWEAVKGLCLEASVSAYDYKFCFFKDVRQGTTLLGRFKQWGGAGGVATSEGGELFAASSSQQAAKPTSWVADGLDAVGLGARPVHIVAKPDSYYHQQLYTNGAHCQGHKRTRSVQVSFQCSPDHAIVDVIEMEICSYHMTISTPMVCTETTDAESSSNLGRLGVFGYTK